MCLPMVVRDPKILLAKGEHLGFEWNITHNGIGFRCGYVRLPLGHPWYGTDFNYIDAEVHGGLTFSDYDTPCGKGDDNGYWIGFDCGHGFDGIDLSLPMSRSSRRIYRRWPDIHGHSIKTTEYVQKECESLCEQAFNVANRI